MTKDPCDGCVVIVDDEEDTRELLKELLEAKGYKVETAEDGVVALDVLSRVPRVCLVILDVLMPRMTGVEVLAKLAADPVHAKLPVWMATSAPDRVPAGVPCLQKPVDVDRLLELVEQHCVRAATA